MQFIEAIKPKVSVACYKEVFRGKNLCQERFVLLTGDDITIHSFNWKDTKHAEIHISSMHEKMKEIVHDLYGATLNNDLHLIKGFKTVVTNEEIGTFREITLYRCNFESYLESNHTIEISFEAYDVEH